jgi:hypothetical protein
LLLAGVVAEYNAANVLAPVLQAAGVQTPLELYVKHCVGEGEGETCAK